MSSRHWNSGVPFNPLPDVIVNGKKTKTKYENVVGDQKAKIHKVDCAVMAWSERYTILYNLCLYVDNGPYVPAKVHFSFCFP